MGVDFGDGEATFGRSARGDARPTLGGRGGWFSFVHHTGNAAGWGVFERWLDRSASVREEHERALFLYGEPSCGKSALVDAGIECARRLGWKCLCFDRDAALAGLRQSARDGRSLLEGTEALVVLDDIHLVLLDADDCLQHALVRLMDQAMEQGAFIVSTSIVKPSSLLLHRHGIASLRKRFQCCQAVEVRAPDLDAKRRILEAHAAAWAVRFPGSEIDDAVWGWLAAKDSTIRRLIGFACRLNAVSGLLDRRIDVAGAQREWDDAALAVRAQSARNDRRKRLRGLAKARGLRATALA